MQKSSFKLILVYFLGQVRFLDQNRKTYFENVDGGVFKEI